MKINGKSIFSVVSHKNVLVEKTIKGLHVPDSVPIYHDFDYDKFIGIATLTKKGNNKIYADIYLLSDIKGFPAIAYVPNTKVYCLSVGGTPNVDKTIGPLL